MSRLFYIFLPLNLNIFSARAACVKKIERRNSADGRQIAETGLSTDWAMDSKPRRIVKGSLSTTYLYDTAGNRVMKRKDPEKLPEMADKAKSIVEKGNEVKEKYLDKKPVEKKDTTYGPFKSLLEDHKPDSMEIITIDPDGKKTVERKKVE